jgi:hypothetical protein
MCSARFADFRFDELRQDGDVEYVAGVDEGVEGRVTKAETVCERFAV